MVDVSVYARSRRRCLRLDVSRRIHTVADPAVVRAVRVAAPALRIMIEELPRFSTRGADSAVPFPLFIAALPDSTDQHHGENHYSWYHFWYHSFKVVRKTANKTRMDNPPSLSSFIFSGIIKFCCGW